VESVERARARVERVQAAQVQAAQVQAAQVQAVRVQAAVGDSAAKARPVDSVAAEA